MDCFAQNSDALAWLDAPSTSEDDMMFMDLITTPRAAARAQQLKAALPATQRQRQVSSPPQVVPQALLPFPGPHDAAAAFKQNCWGLAQQPWHVQEPCAAISGPIADLDLILVPDVPAAWDAYQLVPGFDDNSAGQLRAPGSLPGLAPGHISAGFSSGPSTLSAQFPAGVPCAATAAPWSLSSTELRQQLPPVLECFQPLPRSSLCAGIGCSASPACLAPAACSTALPRPASAVSLSAGAESAATVAAVLAAAAQTHAAPGGQGPLQCNPSLASAAGIDRFHAGVLTGSRPAVHTLPLSAAHDIGSAGSATPAAGSMLGQRAAAAHAQQAAMLAAASALLPALPPKSSALTAGRAMSAVPGGCGSGSGSGSRGSALKGSGPVMKPPAARLTRPASGAVVKPPRAAQVQRRRSGLEEALQASAVEAEESKIQALASRRANLQSTVQALQDSRAQLAANRDTLLTDLTMMSASNQQLKAANRQVKAQLQVLVQQLQQTGLRAA